MNVKLRKNLGLLHVFCIAAGAMISSGIFVLPGLAHAKAGPAVIVSYFLAGLLACIGLLNIAELTTAMPRAGGDYFFITRSMGPAVGTVAGILTWFSLSLKSAFALVGMAAFIRVVTVPAMPDIVMRGIAVALCLAFVVINLSGSREAARLQVGLVIVLLSLMALYIVLGLPAVRTENLDPVAPKGLPAILYTAGFVFVAYGGLLKVSSIAEEVRNPGRAVPLGMILSLMIVASCYTLMVLVTTGVLPGQTLDQSLTPISDGAAAFMGPWGARLMGLAAILAFVSTANAGIMAASRYLLALSRDELAPAFLKRVNRRFHTPHNAIALTGIFITASLFLDLYILVEAASTVLILSYTLSCLCVIILRESRLQNYRPQFRAPLYPWLQILGAAGFTLLIVEMGEEAYLISCLLILVGFATYWFYGRPRVSRDYALMHLVERITSRELVTGSLETELKQIIRERDEIVRDRFDELVEQCHVLDLRDPIARDDFFTQVAERMASRMEMTVSQFRDLLVAREHESPTVLGPSIAVPHIIVEGETRFDMLVARCQGGVHFSSDAPCVRTVVVLAGSRSERNFHLRCLAAIAQIVQASDFESRWRRARNEQALRDILLLGERRRDD